MNIIPRKDEVNRVVELLESGDFESSQDLAKVIIKTVAEDLAKRDTLGVGFGLPGDDMVIPVGPYYHQIDVNAAIKHFTEAGLRAFQAPLFSPILREPQRAPGARCESCNHAVQFHDGRGCWAFTAPKVRCECRHT